MKCVRFRQTLIQIKTFVFPKVNGGKTYFLSLLVRSMTKENNSPSCFQAILFI